MIHHLGISEQALRDAESFEAFHDSAAAEPLRDAILTQLAAADVLSLDVFDTVLWRDEKSELARFAEIAERFVARARLDQPDFAPTARACLVARIASAATAYQLSEPLQGTTEGRLSDIARAMTVSLRLPAAARAPMAALWIATEMDVESEQLRLSPFADGLMQAAAKAGRRVILLSDMYLDSRQIHRLLETAGCGMNRIARLVSTAETRLNKRSGTIFAPLAAQLGTAPERILHIGDSLVSDYRRPIEAGWRARHLPVPRRVLAARRACHLATCAELFGAADFALPMSVPSL